MNVDAELDPYEYPSEDIGFELYDGDGGGDPPRSSSPADTNSDSELVEVPESSLSHSERIQEPHGSQSTPDGRDDPPRSPNPADTSSDSELVEVPESSFSQSECIQEPHGSLGAPSIMFSPEDQTNEQFESLGSLLWRGILYFAAFLNLRFHLSHRGCNLFLSFCKVLLTYCDVLQREDKPELTLKTTFRTLGLQDRFEVRPMCQKCKRTYPVDSDPDTRCLDCDEPLFKTKERLAQNFDGSVQSEEDQTAVPVLKFPYRSLTSQLEELLGRPGMEDALDHWRYVRRRPGRLGDIMDGMVWKTLKGSDGRLFFDNSPSRDSPDELRVGITLGFDG